MAVTVSGVLGFCVTLFHLPTFPLFCAYLVLAWMVPFWKQYTKPIELRKVLIVFNFTLSMASGYIMLGFIYGLWESGDLFSKRSNPTLQHAFSMYFATKLIELLDTGFMVLRHKTRQITFLHIFHHSTMLILSDYARQYAPWPAVAPFLCMNAFVHVVLYLYYGLTALYPDDPPKWKRQVTEVQLLQFLVLLIHGLYGWMYHGQCIYSILYGLAMIGLFSNFYYKAYFSKGPLKVTEGKNR